MTEIVTTAGIEIILDLESYRLWKTDLTLWLFGIANVLIMVHSLGRGSYDDMLYYVLFGVGFGYAMMAKREELTNVIEGDSKRIRRIQMILIPVFGFITSVIAVVAMLVLKYPFTLVEHNFTVATTEQLLYAILIPNLFVRMFPYGFKLHRGSPDETSIPAYLFGIVISAGLFVLAHIYRYSGWGLAYIGGIGLFLHFIGYMNPSISIILHFGLNTFAG